MRGATPIPCAKNTFPLRINLLLALHSDLMALGKDRSIKDIQARINYLGGGPSMQGLDHAPSLELFGNKGSMLDYGGESSESLGSYSSSLLPILSDPSNSSCSGYLFGAVNSPQPHVARAVGQWTAGGGSYSSSSLLCFDQDGERASHAGFLNTEHEDESGLWIDAMDQNYLQDHTKHGAADHHSSRLIQDQSCFEMESCYGLSNATSRYKRCGEDQFGLLYPGTTATVVDRSVVQESSVQAQGPQKRQSTDGDIQLPSPKKQCVANRKSKGKSSPSKDPQSLAAKNRRERISERLKVLQDLVPNGTKVDLVTMLEKAITYVKFLQLQVKVLATDEFWPAQGRKAPELSQVKDAIDAILSSQRGRTTSLMK